MFLHFFNFELRFWLRGWMVWIFFLVIGLLFFGAVSSDHVTVGRTLGNTYKNAPWVIENFYAICSVLTLLMTTAFVNSAASREFACNMNQIVFATPLKKFDYLAGRFLGSALVAVIPMLGVSTGILLGKYMPWIDAERWGSVVWMAHLKAILVFAIPNTLFISAIIFAIAVLSRSTVVSFVGGLLLLVGSAASQALTTDLQNQTLAALIDPFGTVTFNVATKYWTVADKNTLTLGYSGLLLWNRLIWMGVGLLVFAFAYWRFSFAERTAKVKKKRKVEETTLPAAVEVPAVTRQFGQRAQWAQFLGSARLEFRRLIKTIPFIVVTAAALLNCLTSLIFNSTESYGNTSFPVTYQMLELIAGTLYIFLIALITYHAGVLIWEERDSNTDEVHDALPTPEWPAYAAKFLALMISIAIIQGVAMVTAILVQYFHHYYRYQIGLYVGTLFGIDFTLFVFLAVLAFFIHVISPNKYVGYFGFIGFAIVNAFIWRPLHIATNLVQFAQTPNMVYSDFFGYAPFLEGWSWFVAYWTAFCVVMVAATLALWPRGRDTRWSARLLNARRRFHGSLRAMAVFGAVAFVAIGMWIFYNTKVLNTLRSEDDQDTIQADYEKNYKKYVKEPHPRITDVKYAIDIYPERRGMEMRGDETIVNKTGQPLSDVRFTLTDNYDTKIDVEKGKLTQDDARLLFQTYTLDPPMQPGESRTVHFTVKARNRGFENSVTNREIVQNGTFFNSSVAPMIGYQPTNEMTDRNKRKKFGLKEQDLMPALEQNCTADCSDNYLTNNADWVNVETVISTSPDQIAVAPGSLQREWGENGRHYYHYKLDHYSLNFYSFISARYEVARSEWNGMSIEVYYLKEHPWNVPKMLNSVKKSFAYYTQNFGPYPHKEARIIEFPRVARFAQAFPGTMPYSESIGFIANLEHPDDIDFVFYVVAHEMGHQWWAHQVVGANMQGATLLSETLAQYSALMTMEKEYGADTMRKFMQYEMDNYLRSRGTELLKERPLLRVEASQGYIHYRKGSVALYYLKDMIGEDAVNRALHKVLAEYGYKDPPYPTSYALMDALREQIPPDKQYLLEELFYDITLFSNRGLTATAHKRSDGKYDVTVEVETRKYKADEKGNETEIPVNDWIEVGALGAPEKGKKYGKVLHRERVHMSTGKSTFTFTTDTLPEKAGIDPLLLMIDRVPDDNLAKVTVQ
ncbi:MAG TPA: M1 family aminopeptidase [Terriglobales bacterium]|nr:M1 family aminopeptidase [Terriglobales bacterium]